MEGASVAGGAVERAKAALSAGCDMVLVCNDAAAAGKVLEDLNAHPVSPHRAARMRASPVQAQAQYRAALEVLHALAA
jgi:beta-N-acetylhexosaminidase